MKLYLQNIYGTCALQERLKSKSTDDRFFKKVLVIKVFKNFECTAIFYIPLENWTKLHRAGEREILAGVSKG